MGRTGTPPHDMAASGQARGSGNLRGRQRRRRLPGSVLLALVLGAVLAAYAPPQAHAQQSIEELNAPTFVDVGNETMYFWEDVWRAEITHGTMLDESHFGFQQGKQRDWHLEILDYSSASAHYRAQLQPGDRVGFELTGGHDDVPSVIPWLDATPLDDTGATPDSQPANPGSASASITSSSGGDESGTLGWNQNAFYRFYTVSPRDTWVRVTVSGGGATLVIDFDVVGEDGALADPAVVHTTASETPGEVGGIPIPAVIVGAAVVIAGGAALIARGRKGKKRSGDNGTDGPDDETQKEEDRCRYEMRVAKNFGSTVYIGDAPQAVRARIVRITPEGAESTDEALTSMISITSGYYLDVGPTRMAGGYAEADVSAPDLSNTNYAEPDEGIVEFTLLAGEASFTNRMHFKIARLDAYIQLPEGDTLSVIAGDGGTYEAAFRIMDASREPDDIRLEARGDFEPSYERVGDFTYKLKVKNNTAPMEAPIFTPTSNLRGVKICAVYGKSECEANVVLAAWPEGLSLSSDKVENDRLQIRSYPAKTDADPDEMPSDPKLGPVTFWLTLAVSETGPDGITKAVFPDLHGSSPKVGPFTADEPHTRVLLNKWRYGIEQNSVEDEQFELTPKDSVPAYYRVVNGKKAVDLEYLADMHISASHDGHTYEADVPARIVGAPFDPLSVWRDEYRKLLQAINVFVDDQERKGLMFENVRALAPGMTPTELYMRRNALFVAYRNYWTADAAIHMADSRTLDYLITGAEWVKFAGDVAFSYLVTIYAGPVAEAIISPMKDMYVGMAGEFWACVCHGTTNFNFESMGIFQNFDALGENLIMAFMSKKMKSPADMKTAATFLITLFFYQVFYNYTFDVDKEGRRSLYKAFGKAFASVTVQTVKALVGLGFQKLMANPKIHDFFYKKVGGWASKLLGAKVTDALRDFYRVKLPDGTIKNLTIGGGANPVPTNMGVIDDPNVRKVFKSDIAEKYVVEFFGKLGGDYFDSVIDPQPPAPGPDQMDIPLEVGIDNERIQAGIIRINVRQVLETDNELSRALYDDMFGWWFKESPNTTAELPDAPVVPDEIADGTARA